MNVVPVVVLPPLAILAANIVVWFVAQAASGWWAHRLPLDRVATDGPVLRLRRVEAGGRLYERTFRIRRWKDRLPEAGDLFAGGVSKRQLPRTGDGGLERFAAETRRAERAHWVSLTCLPLFPLWNPPIGVAILVAYGLVANLPFIAVQRYNRARVDRILARRARRSGSRPGTGTEQGPTRRAS